MELEHSNKDSFKTSNFATSNYDIETTPSKEWTYVMNPDSVPEKQRVGGRTIQKIDVLMQEKASISAKLIRAEVIAVVLYTGPMVF